MKSSNNMSNWNVEPTAKNDEPTAINAFVKRPGSGKSPGSRPFFMAVKSLFKRSGAKKSPGSRPF